MAGAKRATDDISVMRLLGFALSCALVTAPVAAPVAAMAAPPPERITFDEDVHPIAPDYADAASWAVLPGQPDLSRETPGGGTASIKSTPVDVFYIQPTTFVSTGTWNQKIDDWETNAWTDVSVVARQASIFNGCCRIFVPRYRQASTGSIIAKGSSGRQAYDLAYEDVKRAFDYYLAHYNHGRPFILAGHSQGAYHIYRLIEEEIDGKPLQKQMVAAYPIGVATYVGAFGRTYKSVKPCLKPLQTGCIVSWNSFMSDADPSIFIEVSEDIYVKRYGDTTGKQMLCINPLTFDADRPAAAATLDAGALAWPPLVGPLPALIPHAVSATCQNGVLMVTPSPDVNFKPFVLPGGSLHMQDTDLFYQAVRDNAAARVDRYLAENQPH
jgi:hypothetical protein